MTVKNRILSFLKLKGISKRQFYADTGLSNGTLDKVENIGSDKVEKIYDAYPEINLVWLITGKGEMIEKSKGGLEEELLNSSAQLPEVEKNKVDDNLNKNSGELEKRIENLELDMKLLKKNFLKLKR